jgi:hypothetical protein
VTHKKHPASDSPVGENSSLMRAVEDEWQANMRATNRQNNGAVQQWCEERHLERRHSSTRVTDGLLQQKTTRPLLSAKNKKKLLQWARHHQHWTIEEWKNIAWSHESRFLLDHADGRVWIFHKQHESMDL